MLAALAVTGALAAATPAVAAPPPVLDCRGPVAPDATAASLARTFGAANVRSEELDGAEGETQRGTVLFPSDPSRRLEIWWTDVKRQRRPASIRISDRSRWRVAVPGQPGRELQLRAGLAEVESLNGRPFKVAGFGWDYGGYPDFMGGRLEQPKHGCGLTLRFNPDDHAREKDVDKVTGEASHRSRDPLMVRVKPYVSVIDLNLP